MAEGVDIPLAEEGSTPSEREIVVITGMSGAGRSEAMHTFEDLGYFCIDNIPPALISQLVALTALPGSRVRHVAVVCDVRGGSFFTELSAALEDLRSSGHPYRLLFLTADDRTLVRRFKETRRRHPLADEKSLGEGIKEERKLLEPFEAGADLIIDSSHLRPQELRAVIRQRFLSGAASEALSVTVSSFGFKYGIPIDADIVIDVRFLPNPFYMPKLRDKTGLDKPVRAFVLGRVETEEFLRRWFDMLDVLIPAYVAEGKSQLHVALGCTGGMHRSVVLAEQTGEHLRRHGEVVNVSHRDLGKDKDRQ